MIQRRFPTWPPFRRPGAARDVWDATSEGVAAASWADTFRVEHADLVGDPPEARPRRHRWLVAACILGLVVMAVVLHADLRRMATGSKRGWDVEQRRVAIAEAVSQELVRTRETFEAHRVQAARDIASAQESLTAREVALQQAEQARRTADDLAAERARTIETMASDLALARREVAQAQAEAAEARVATDTARAALAVAQTEAAMVGPAAQSPPPDLITKAAQRDEPVATPAEVGVASSGIPTSKTGESDAGEGPRFGHGTMAWLPLSETAFMSLDAGPARIDTAPAAVDVGGTSCLNGPPVSPQVASPPLNGKGARLPRTRQRAGVKAPPSQGRGAGARQRRTHEGRSDFLSGDRPAPLPDRS